MRLEGLIEELEKNFDGEIRFDEGAKALYATDSSNYRQVPLGVLMPKSEAAVITAVKLCREYGVPILARGGGTSLAGQCCNEAVVFDMSKYYNRVLEIDPEARTARVEPGVVLDELRNAAGKHGLTFGPDPATHNRCTLGGMLGNNSCGVHSVMSGRTADNVVSLKVLTYEGDILEVGETPPEEFKSIMHAGGRRAEIYRKTAAIERRYSELIRERFPKIPRRVSGYGLDQLLPENGFHVGRALVGTEGTCVMILAATLRLIHKPAKSALVVLGFRTLEDSARAVPLLMQHKPIGLEGIDDVLVAHMKKKHLHVDDLPYLPEGNTWLLVEIGEDSDAALKAKKEEMYRATEGLAGLEGRRAIFAPEIQKRVWEVRESGLGATAFVPDEPITWEGWEDSAVAPEHLADYLTDLRKLFNKYGYIGALYGHFGQGCVHTRISFDLFTAEGIKNFRQFLGEAADLVLRYGGSFSGEHGDGQSRAELLPKMYGPELVQAFQEFKAIWDPLGKMNPGKIVNPYRITDNLRIGSHYLPNQVKTEFQFPQDHGSFAHAAIRCVGVGLCRKKAGGVMCPSYMVTHEEKHSTRGRAHLLFEMLRGEIITDGWRSKEVKEALDLCLSCKGCKGECPVGVDLASYKAEFLSHHYKWRLRPRSAYSMGLIALWAKIGAKIPRLTNFLMRAWGVSYLLKKLAGIHPARQVPAFARETFRKWFKKHRHSGAPDFDLILWPDTFTNYFHPEIGKAALEVLETAGFRVKIPEQQFCCGRPLYDYGFLKTARRWLEQILAGMRQEIEAGVPIVFLEPSCAAVFRDELGNLLPNNENARRLKKQSYTLGEFLLKKAPHWHWPEMKEKLIVHGHCHHRSVLNFTDEVLALKKVCPNLEILDSGCCGMAGSFGFEDKHYELSQAIGDRMLFPAVRNSGGEAFVVANGFSCRTQIEQGTSRHALHLAEVFARALQVQGNTEEKQRVA